MSTAYDQDSPADTKPVNKPPLKRSQTIIIVAQAVLAVGVLVAGFISASGSDGWADLVRVAVAVLAGAYFVGATASWLIARYLVSNDVVRVLIGLAVPPLVTVLFILMIRTG
jgi:hypothetical protein